MTLEIAFGSLTDPRRKQGQRTSLTNTLIMIVVSKACGNHTYRKMSEFCRAHQELFTVELNLKHPTPSHVSIRDVLVRIDQDELIAAFNKWAETFVELKDGDEVSGDGKGLCSTVTDAHNADQDFQSIVSFFCHKTGMTKLIETYKNKKKSEIYIAENMIKALKDKELTLVFDALPIQKKQ